MSVSRTSPSVLGSVMVIRAYLRLRMIERISSYFGKLTTANRRSPRMSMVNAAVVCAGTASGRRQALDGAPPSVRGWRAVATCRCQCRRGQSPGKAAVTERSRRCHGEVRVQVKQLCHDRHLSPAGHETQEMTLLKTVFSVGFSCFRGSEFWTSANNSEKAQTFPTRSR